MHLYISIFASELQQQITHRRFQLYYISYIDCLYEVVSVHKKDKCLQFKVICCALSPISYTVKIASFLTKH